MEVIDTQVYAIGKAIRLLFAHPVTITLYITLNSDGTEKFPHLHNFMHNCDRICEKGSSTHIQLYELGRP